GKARASVLRRIDSEIAARETPALVGADDVDDEPTIATPSVQIDNPGLDAAEDEPFPIEDYDDLRAGEILPLLPQLYADALERLAAHERATANRGAILEEIDRLLSPAPAPAKKAAAAKSTATAVKKAPAAAKKAAAEKV